MTSVDTQAREIMSDEVLTVRVGTPLEDVLKLLVNSRITGLPVTDAEGRLLGVVSELDVLKQISASPTLDADTFRQPMVYSSQVETITDGATLGEVTERFLKTPFRRFPVVDRDGRLVGIITRRDLMRVYFYRARLGI